MTPVAIVTVIATALAVIAALVLVIGLVRMSRPRPSSIVDFPELPPPEAEPASQGRQPG